jgi:hypothetical protein
VGILLSGYLPPEDKQGLSALEAALLAEPDREIIVVGPLVQHSLTEPRGPNAAERDVTLQLKWAALEAVDVKDEQSVRSMINSLAAERRGQLELETERGAEQAAMVIDPDHPSQEPRRRRGRGRGGLRTVPAT